MLEEITLTPAADPLHTPLQQHAPARQPAAPHPGEGQGQPAAGTRGHLAGKAWDKHMETSWSSPGPEGAAHSRCILSHHHCCTVSIAGDMTGLCASPHHMLRTAVRELDSGSFGTKLELTVSSRPFLAWLQGTHATRAHWPATLSV